MDLEQPDLGETIAVREFEEAVIKSGLMEDLMDRTDLRKGEFLNRAISRMNSRLTPQHLHRLVLNAEETHVVVVRREFEPLILRLRHLLQQAQSSMNTAKIALAEAIQGGVQS